jgi:2-oxoisovalerate dehydrogenase E1 component
MLNIEVLKTKIIKRALKIRAFEDILIKLFNEGKINGTIHTCTGQEINGATIGTLINENDHIVSNHRGHGHYVGRFDEYESLLAEIMGKETGCSGGYGGSQHICGKNFLSNGIQGGMTPIALGIAVSNRQCKNDFISVAFIGDGTLGQGVLYETMNFAGVLKSSLLIIVENNGYAQSTPQKLTFQGDLKNRVLGFGFDYYNYNTNLINLEEFIETSNQAIENTRKGKPTLFEINTYRLNAHSKGDDNRFLKELLEAKNNDYLTNLIINEKYYLELYNGYLDEIYTASERLSSKKTLTNILKIVERNNYEIEYPLVEKSNTRYNQRINKALYDLMIEFGNIYLIGEDIIDKSEYTEFDYGGAFKVTSGLSNEFGSRVINTPISEQCIIGVSTGMGIRGFTIIPEIMFGDFTTLIVDQVLQHLTKFEIIYNGLVRPSVIIRTPMGGKRGYGPTHSQSIEKLFLGIPNLRVIVLNKYINPYEIYKKLVLDEIPSMVIENKILYTERTEFDLKGYYNYRTVLNGNFPVVSILPFNSSQTSIMTILTYGQTISEIEKVSEYFYFEEEIVFDIFCFTRIDMIDCYDILNSAERTKKVLIIEEGNGFASWGSEMVSYISEKLRGNLEFYRISNNDVIPSSLSAELEIIPNKDLIIKKIKNVI